MGILPPTNEQIDNYFKGGATRLELRSEEREQTEEIGGITRRVLCGVIER